MGGRRRSEGRRVPERGGRFAIERASGGARQYSVSVSQDAGRRSMEVRGPGGWEIREIRE